LKKYLGENGTEFYMQYSFPVNYTVFNIDEQKGAVLCIWSVALGWLEERW
jgi:hypothetical protein